MKSYVDTLCEHFGVSRYEAFKFVDDDAYYRVGELTLEVNNNGNWEIENQVMVCCKWDIPVQIPFLAKGGNWYYFKDIIGCVQANQFMYETFDYMCLAMGNAFVTREEAERYDLKEKLKEMGVEV